MRRFTTRLFATLSILALLSTPVMAYDTARRDTLEVEKTHPMWDAFFLRPVGALGLAVSACFWLPVETVVLMVRPSEWKMPIDMMLKEPYEFVFVDPLGSH